MFCGKKSAFYKEYSENILDKTQIFVIPCDKNEPQKSTEPVKTCWFYCHKELRSYREYRHVMHFFFFKNRPHIC